MDIKDLLQFLQSVPLLSVFEDEALASLMEELRNFVRSEQASLSLIREMRATAFISSIVAESELYKRTISARRSISVSTSKEITSVKRP